MEIEESRPESPVAKTIFFRDEACLSARPGQFVMIWALGNGEMPMSLSSIDVDGRSSVTVKPWGPASTQLCNLAAGDRIGLRGPYGTPFTLEQGSVLVAGGGTGVAPLIPLSRDLMRTGAAVTLLIAGKTASDLLLVLDAEKLFAKPPHRLILATDDGSRGAKGQAPDAVRTILSRGHIDFVYTCGPELMMRKIFDIAEEKGLPVQASLERYMECAVGLCGICAVGRYVLCRDGPVLSSKQLEEVLNEFGVSRLDRSGRFVPIGNHV